MKMNRKNLLTGNGVLAYLKDPRTTHNLEDLCIWVDQFEKSKFAYLLNRMKHNKQLVYDPLHDNQDPEGKVNHFSVRATPKGIFEAWLHLRHTDMDIDHQLLADHLQDLLMSRAIAHGETATRIMNTEILRVLSDFSCASWDQGKDKGKEEANVSR